MKKATFSLEKFASSNVKTLESKELNLILGATAVVAQCSNSGDYDSQSSGCSNTNDHDDQKN